MNRISKLTPQEEYEVVLLSLQNPQEFRVIYETYYTDIFRFIFSRINEPNITADIVSTVFYKAMTKLNTYSFMGQSIKSWIVKIAYNEMMQFFRTEKLKRTVSIEEQDFVSIAEDTTEEIQLSMEMIIPFLNELNDNDLTLLELKYFEKMSYKEIGEIMGITDSNARVKLHRIIKNIEKKARKEAYNEQ